MIDPEVQGVLAYARSLVEQGWVKGTYERDGRYCMIGALRTVVWGTPYPKIFWHSPIDPKDPQYRLYSEARERLEQVVGQPIGGWNDLWRRTKDEVLDAFTEAIG